MRHLNKIVFINSANIPYAEVMLDGNVHFAGTQGVGKSTVLRALLFFYNADKMKLGIQQGQKTFEEFYFKYNNSYIVYEVKTDQSAYSILLSRSQGRVVYRFIDAPFKKDWLVGKDGRSESDWIKIRERIGQRVDISSKIETYELYRNIIFGSTNDRSHRYDKYAIVESAKSQNISRSIQNVFLNSKLDADFVKNTIIQSMADSEDKITLSTYRHLVEDFEKEFDEIDCWYKKDANGDVLVRTKAQKAVDTYRLLVALDYELMHTWHQLSYAVNHTKEQIPFTEDKIRVTKESLEKLREKLAGAQEEYTKEHDLLIKKIGSLDGRLSDIREKRKHYDDIKIGEIIALVEKEPKLLQEKKQKEAMLAALQEKYKDVTDKYKTLFSALDAELKAFESSQVEEKNRKNAEKLSDQDSLQKSRDTRKRTIDASYSEWLTVSDERVKSLNEAFNNADKRLSELRYWHPLESEINSCKKDITDLETKKKDLESQLAVVRNELKSLRKEAELEYDQVEKDYARQMDAANESLDQLKQDLSKTEALLSRWTGSLYEWLSQNKPGWENTIGKVVDENEVLYAQGLSPELSGGDSLFGVKLNLEAIPVHHRTPDEYKTLKVEQETAVSTKKQEIVDLQTAKENALESLKKAFKGKVSDLQQQETNLDVQLSQIPTKIKDAETRLRQLRQREDEQIAEEREKRTKAYHDATLSLERENDSRNQRKAKRDRDLKSADSEYNSGVKSLQKAFEDFCVQQKMDFEAKQ
ncbi:MAG: ATP-binding protein, partial [Bacteroidales bacterium]|nr:ATP-binding protein [Bacteroidales bacterium]